MNRHAISQPLRVNAVFISDVHLGFKGCQAEALLSFLHTIDTNTLYLIGDIIDIWQINKQPTWPDSHTQVLRRFVDMSKAGTKIIYIPGNHDEAFRRFSGLNGGNITIRLKDTHTTIAGKKLLITHGDQFDSVIQSNKFIGIIGSQIYDWVIDVNLWFNTWRKKAGLTHWSLATFVKSKMENSLHYIKKYRQVLAYEARKGGYDGVVCGHIHHPEITLTDGTLYCNDGDWVENGTALIEHVDGRLELLTPSAHPTTSSNVREAA